MQRRHQCALPQDLQGMFQPFSGSCICKQLHRCGYGPLSSASFWCRCSSTSWSSKTGLARYWRQRGAQLVAGLDCLELFVQRLVLVGGQRQHRLDRDREHQVARIPHRLPHREVAGGGQHICLLVDLYLLRSAHALPEAGADDRHHRGHRTALAHDSGGRLVAGRVPLDFVCVRRFLDPHRCEDVVGRGPRAELGRQPCAQALAQGVACEQAVRW